MEEKRTDAAPEIDLFYFLRPLTSLARKCLAAISYYFRIIGANRILFFAIIAALILAGFGVKKLVREGYETDALLVSHVLPASVCADMLEQINDKAVSPGNLLHLNPEAAAALKRVIAEPLKIGGVRRTFDSVLFYNRGDTALNAVQVTLVIYDMKWLDTIRVALLDYLNRSPYVMARTAARRVALAELKDELSKKEESLDSIQLLVNRSILPRRENVQGDPPDPVTVNKTAFNYQRMQISIDQELATMDDVEILSPFTRLDFTNYPDTRKLLGLAVVAGIVLALIITPWLGRKPK